MMVDWSGCAALAFVALILALAVVGLVSLVL